MVFSVFDGKVFSGGQLFLLQEFMWDNFVFVFIDGGFGIYLCNFVIVVFVMVFVSVLVCLFVVVVVVCFKFKFCIMILMMILVVQMVLFEVFVILLFLQVKSLGLFNSIFGLMVVYVVLLFVFGIWMLCGFVVVVLVEFEEVVYIDGVSWWWMFCLVLLLLVMLGFVVISIFSFIMVWNEFIFVMMIFGVQIDQYMVLIGLKLFFGLYLNDWGSIMVVLIIIMVFVMIFFVLVQCKFVFGMVVGVVKG